MRHERAGSTHGEHSVLTQHAPLPSHTPSHGFLPLRDSAAEPLPIYRGLTRVTNRSKAVTKPTESRSEVTEPRSAIGARRAIVTPGSSASLGDIWGTSEVVGDQVIRKDPGSVVTKGIGLNSDF